MNFFLFRLCVRGPGPAEWVAGNSANVKAYLLEAQKLTAEVGDPEDRELLEKDLASIQAALNQTEQAL